MCKQFSAAFFLALFCVCSPHFASASPSYILYATGYVPNSGEPAALFTVNTATGLATKVGPSGYSIHSGGLAYVESTGTLYATGHGPSGPTTTELFTVDLATGAATPLGWTGPTGLLNDGGLAYDATNDFLYATGQNNTVGPTSVSTLYSVNRSTGAATVIGPTGSNSNLACGGLAFDSSGQLIGTGNFTGTPSSDSLFELNTASGFASLVGPTDPPYYLDSGGLAVNPLTSQVFATGVVLNGGQYESLLFAIDRATGHATLVGPTGDGFIGFGGLAFVPVPEPPGMLLLATGILSLLIGWRVGNHRKPSVEIAWLRGKANPMSAASLKSLSYEHARQDRIGNLRIRSRSGRLVNSRTHGSF